MSEAQAQQSQAATLFQKAHGKIMMMQRVDQQIAALISQRRKLQEDINGVQSQINEEFERLAHQSDELPARLLSEISGAGRMGDVSSIEMPASSRMDTSEPVAAGTQYRDNE
jgi:hypothetical protein